MQKSRSKAKEHTLHLKNRLKQWLEGDLESLLWECRTIQHRLSRQHHGQSKSPEYKARAFSKLMMEGKVRAALRLIAEENSGGPLLLNSKIRHDGTTLDTVREALLKKHPPKQPSKPSSIISIDTEINHPHTILFESIAGPLIRNTALRMDGAAGPSGLDAAAWKRLCSSFKSASDELCDSLACLARRICTTYVDPKSLSAFIACRLIALDKCPGIRPIGIGETVRRIIGKSIAVTIREDIQAAAGSLQVCAGHLSGCEAAVHAMRQIFENPVTEAALLVDASNAFNSLNRQTALLNILHLCPAISKVLVNTYRDDVQLFIDGQVLLSEEGTTQGDPLAMAMYAIAITPLIHHLENEQIKQIWYADDATASGNLSHLRTWWDTISTTGPDFGYYPNASKTWLIVKEGYLEKQEQLPGNWCFHHCRREKTPWSSYWHRLLR